ncbi:MAG: FAD-dependent oxidoreductase [Pseudomonadales bacterium]|jgi:glycine/D-amino acid oxidase-like deaminating enzyme|nr:FAD-dependent oxidoreductase [Pseudomonadales bacterium]
MRPDPLRALGDVRFAPYWLDAPERPAPLPALDGDLEVDLLIVGGGFTGLWAALLAKEADPERRVVLVEADRIACGASGRPGAIVSSSVMHGLANAARTYPEELDVLERLGRENLEGLRATLARHRIACDEDWGGELTVAIGDAAVPGLEDECALHRRHGHDVAFLDATAVREEIDSPLFTAGLWNRGGCGTVHPAKLAWGLRDATRGLGVELFEHTPLRGIERDRGELRVHTPDGRIRTRRVLLATNAFAAGDRRIRRRVATVRDRILVTEPLTDEQRARIGWVNRQGVYDTRTQLNYMRLIRDPAGGGRILFGGKLAYGFGDATSAPPDFERRTYESLAAAFLRTFPQLADVRFSHAWSGPIALTTRMAVHFQRYHGGDVVWAGGYSGFGVSASRFGARVGLAVLDREDRPETRMRFARELPSWIPPEPFRGLGAALTLYALDTADAKGGWRRPWLRLVQALGFPLH